MNLQASLNAQKLAQESTVASIGSDLADARRRARADEELAKKGSSPSSSRARRCGRANELAGRLEFEKKRLVAQSQGIAAQVAAQRAQVERLRAIAEFRRKEVDGLKLRAGVDGVLQELPLQHGQAVAAGALLAKVVRPDQLKAEIRIPETQAKDVRSASRPPSTRATAWSAGHVVRIDPAAQAGTVTRRRHARRRAARGRAPRPHVEGTIEIERLQDVLYVGPPRLGPAGRHGAACSGSSADGARRRAHDGEAGPQLGQEHRDPGRPARGGPGDPLGHVPVGPGRPHPLQ